MRVKCSRWEVEKVAGDADARARRRGEQTGQGVAGEEDGWVTPKGNKKSRSGAKTGSE